MSGYGPTKGFRLIAATLDPTTLKPENTWYLATTLPLEEASPGQVYEVYLLRDWIEHYYKPAKHEPGGPITRSVPKGRLCATGS